MTNQEEPLLLQVDPQRLQIVDDVAQCHVLGRDGRELRATGAALFEKDALIGRRDEVPHRKHVVDAEPWSAAEKDDGWS